jgi:DEAD/DEAH box helicase domain-containing protein
VESLDIENRKCLVREAELNYFTDGLVKTDIKVLTEDEFFNYGEVTANPENPSRPPYSAKGVLGDVLVRSQAAKFKKIRFHTHENIGYGDINLGEEELQTRALALLFDPALSRGGACLAGMDEAGAASVLSGAGTLIKRIAPVFLLCDPRDLGLAERIRDPHFGVPVLFIYDKYPGGTGLAEALVRKTEELFHASLRALKQCPCREGCPSCVGPGGNKAGVGAFLEALVSEQLP